MLQSTGSSGAPAWSSGTNSLYNNTIQLIAGQVEPVVNVTTLIPGWSYTFTSSGNCKVLVMPTLAARPGSCVACGASTCYLRIFMDGNQVYQIYRDVPNGVNEFISATYLVTAGAGSHTIEIKALFSGPNTRFAGYYDPAIIQIIRE